MKINIIHDRRCIDEFIRIFKQTSFNTKASIDELLNSPAYQMLIKDIGENFDLATTSQWSELVYQAVGDCMISDDVSFFNKLVISSIQTALANIETLNQKTEELIQFIEKQSFIEKAKYYLPECEQEATVTIVYSIFMKNAAVENQKVYLDIPFTYLLTEPQLNDFLAHEFHHYLKDACQVCYPNYNYLPNLMHFLKILENEGVANLCNFASLESIYRILGIDYGASMAERIKTIDKDFDYFFDLLKAQLAHPQTSISFQDEFVTTFTYIPMSYIMAKTIIDQFGVAHLRTLIGNPIAFLKSFMECREDYKNLVNQLEILNEL